MRNFSLNVVFVFYSVILLFCYNYSAFCPLTSRLHQFFISNQPTCNKMRFDLPQCVFILNWNHSLVKCLLFAHSEMSFHARNIKRNFQAHFMWHVMCVFGSTLESVGLVISSEVQQISVLTLEVHTAVHTGPLSGAFRNQSPCVRVILFEWSPAHLWRGTKPSV